MITPRPTVLEGHGVRLEPLAREHHDGLVAAAGDGELWTLWFTSVPAPGETQAYVAAILGMLNGMGDSDGLLSGGLEIRLVA